MEKPHLPLPPPPPLLSLIDMIHSPSLSPSPCSGWDNPLVALGQIRNGWRPDAILAMLLMGDAHNGYWRTGWNWQGGFS